MIIYWYKIILTKIINHRIDKSRPKEFWLNFNCSLSVNIYVSTKQQTQNPQMGIPNSLNSFPMKSLKFQYLHFLTLFFLVISNIVSSNKIPILSPILQDPYDYQTTTSPKYLSSFSSSSELKTFYYDQTLDHFSYGPQSYKTFKQRYVINFKYWGGAKSNSPILAYLGAEAPLDSDLVGIGFLSENAPTFKALQVYIEVI